MPAPVAAFSASPANVGLDVAVSFTDASTNTPTSWLWTFGDGATSTSQNPNHTYKIPGLYSVSLKATNASGNNTISHNVSVALPFALHGHHLLPRRL